MDIQEIASKKEISVPEIVTKEVLNNMIVNPCFYCPGDKYADFCDCSKEEKLELIQIATARYLVQNA